MRASAVVVLAAALMWQTGSGEAKEAYVSQKMSDAAHPITQGFDAKRYARSLLASRGQSRSEYICLEKIWQRESNWNPKADNPHSSAYGIAQMLGETSHDPARQIVKGLKYIESRYGTACKAWAFWRVHHWY